MVLRGDGKGFEEDPGDGLAAARTLVADESTHRCVEGDVGREAEVRKPGIFPSEMKEMFEVKFFFLSQSSRHEWKAKMERSTVG